MKMEYLLQTVINSKNLYELADNIERLILSFQEIDSRCRQKLMAEFHHMIFVRVFFMSDKNERVKIYSVEESVIEYFYNYWEFATNFKENKRKLQGIVRKIRNEMIQAKATRLSQEAMQNLINLAEEKFQYITKILKEQPLKILQVDYSHIDFNCYYAATVLDDQIANDYVIMTCKHKNEKYQEFSFVHELGHKLHTMITRKLSIPPKSFECFHYLYGEEDRKDSNIMVEHSADVFAIAVLSNSSYERCIPYEVASHNIQLFKIYMMMTIITMDEKIGDLQVGMHHAIQTLEERVC